MDSFGFLKAQPVWAKDRELEKNCELAFRTVIAPGQAVLYLAAASIYRLWVNGSFVSAGPARASHGFYCVDQIDLTDRLAEKENVIVVEVIGFNVNGFDTIDQPSFLTAEIRKGEEAVVYTGSDTVKIYDLKQRVQKVQRYSFQRAFAECYRLDPADRTFYTEADCNREPQSCALQPEKNYLVRSARMPLFENLKTDRLVQNGKVNFDYVCENPRRDRSLMKIGEKLKGFCPDELEEHLSDEGQNMEFLPSETLQPDAFPLALKNEYGIYELPFNATGFLRAKIQCEEECSVYLMFDEVLSDGKLNFCRMSCCNCFKYLLKPGTHSIMTFAPYTMKYVQVVIKGSGVVHSVDMIEYKHPPVAFQVNLPEDEALKKICQAALESYLSNAVDVYMDCPSRERAGWLCDSFFTSRVEKVLTGESVLEKAFLENFLRPERFEFLPEGMLPMCYPSDHNDGVFIPNWAMWFVLELEEYAARTGDRDLIRRAKNRVYALAKYFEAFENEDGLLEKLDGWVFIEWSRANDADVVQDINFPTNMLYMKMLSVIAELYKDAALAKKAQQLRSVIRERSLKGVFFTDNERRTPEGLINPGNCTEVCQYYAFFTGTATKQEDPGLWKILCENFGYQRKETGMYPDVAFANAFIGNYLRIELLYRDHQYERVVDNIRGYFLKMAEQTGTLWENDGAYASCNHGFASHVIYWLAGIYGTHKL